MPYTVGIFRGTTLEELETFVKDELQKIAEEFRETIALELRQTGAEPTKPRDGMIVSANGTTFNPGAGAGAYERKAGAWVKL